MVMLADIFVFIVAILHIGFMVLECFMWQTTFVKRRFAMSDQKAAVTAVLAKNQGVYNLFLAGGLLFAQYFRGEPVYTALVGYCLACVVVAGIVGAFTVTKRIFYVQAIPAVIAAIFVFITA